MPQLMADRNADTRERIAPSPTPDFRISATQGSTERCRAAQLPRRMPAAATLAELLNTHARYGSCDHQLLDLLGPLEDVVDLGVAVHALDRVLPRVPVPAVDLDGPLGHPHRHPAGLQLGLGSLGIAIAAVAGEPRG